MWIYLLIVPNKQPFELSCILPPSMIAFVSLGKTIAFEIHLHIMAIFIKHFCLYTKHNNGDKILFDGA
jgi:hypothetical protein